MSETTTDAEQGEQWAHADDGWKPEEIPTREEIERVEKAAALDDDLDEDTRTTGVEHMTPDNDPYGWIAGVEAAHPDFVEPDARPTVHVEHVLVWQHAMIEPHRFDYAVAKVLPNGTLLVTRPGSGIPLKGYAPGVWVTFEHVGERYHARRVEPASHAAVRPGRIQTTNYTAQERAAVSMARSNAMLAEHADETREEWMQQRPDETRDQWKNRTFVDHYGGQSGWQTEPGRRTPPTFEADADDTQSLPKVQSDDKAAPEGGGGVNRPFGRGVRPDAGYDGHPDRPRTDDPGDDDPKPGRLKSLWRYLTDPDWSED